MEAITWKCPILDYAKVSLTIFTIMQKCHAGYNTEITWMLSPGLVLEFHLTVTAILKFLQWYYAEWVVLCRKYCPVNCLNGITHRFRQTCPLLPLKVYYTEVSWTVLCRNYLNAITWTCAGISLDSYCYLEVSSMVLCRVGGTMQKILPWKLFERYHPQI